MSYLTAKVDALDLAKMRLVPIADEANLASEAHLVIGRVSLFLRRADVARLLFDGQAERLAFYQRAQAVSRIVAECARVEVGP
jgi:hypothetical protein